MKVNTKLIQSLNPCQDRLDNWLKHYKTFNGNILEFLSLDHITTRDKIWVSLKILPRDIVEIFALDCSFRASGAAYAADAAAAYADAAATAAADAADADAAAAYADAAATAADAAAAAYAAAYAAYAAAYAAYAADAADAAYAADAADAERENQVDSLIYLISTK